MLQPQPPRPRQCQHMPCACVAAPAAAPSDSTPRRDPSSWGRLQASDVSLTPATVQSPQRPGARGLAPVALRAALPSNAPWPQGAATVRARLLRARSCACCAGIHRPHPAANRPAAAVVYAPAAGHAAGVRAPPASAAAASTLHGRRQGGRQQEGRTEGSPLVAVPGAGWRGLVQRPQSGSSLRSVRGIAGTALSVTGSIRNSLFFRISWWWSFLCY